MTRPTYLEQRWPNSPPFQAIAQRWCQDRSRLLLELVWGGYDRLLDQDFRVTPFSDTDEDKERSLSILLALRIGQGLSGDEPFSLIHVPPEQTKRKSGRTAPPQPDIGFMLNNYPRTVWPLEAKVLVDDREVGPYVTEINHNLLTGRYATFSSEGAMLGYLLHGQPERTFAAVAVALGEPLIPHPHFLSRPQRMSTHQRDRLPHADSPRDFTCHHLLLRIPTA